MSKKAIGKKLAKLAKEGKPKKQAYAIAKSMESKGKLGPRGGYKKSKKAY